MDANDFLDDKQSADSFLDSDESGKTSASNFLSGIGKAAIGTGEAALNIGTGIGGYLAGIPAAIHGGLTDLAMAARGEPTPQVSNAEREFNEVSNALTYQPRTASGQNQADIAQEFANRVLIPLGGHIGMVPELPERVRGINNEVKPSTGIDSVFNKIDQTAPPTELSTNPYHGPLPETTTSPEFKTNGEYAKTNSNFTDFANLVDSWNSEHVNDKFLEAQAAEQGERARFEPEQDQSMIDQQRQAQAESEGILKDQESQQQLLDAIKQSDSFKQQMNSSPEAQDAFAQSRIAETASKLDEIRSQQANDRFLQSKDAEQAERDRFYPEQDQYDHQAAVQAQIDKANELSDANKAQEDRQSIQRAFDDAQQMIEQFGRPTEDTTVNQLSPEVGFGSSIGGYPRTMRNRGQRGALDIEALSKVFSDVSGGFSRFIEGLDRMTIKGTAAKSISDYAHNIPGMSSDVRNIHVRPETGDTAIPRILEDADHNGKVWNGIQSGPQMYAEKNNSYLAKYVSNWLEWVDKATKSAQNIYHTPHERLINVLSDNEKSDLAKLLREEDKRNIRLTPEQLASTEVSKATLRAYQSMRDNLDRSFDLAVKGNKAIDGPEITRRDAYAASLRNGDYHLTLNDKSGKPVWHIQETSIRNLAKAVNWFKENAASHPNLDLSPLDKFTNKGIDYRGLVGLSELHGTNRATNVGYGIPRDVIAGYHNLMSMFDHNDPTTKAIQFAIQQANKDAGYDLYGEKYRFLNKQGFRGFEGDKPWLSNSENAKATLDSQLQYMKITERWSHMQEALGEIKKVMSNDDIVKAQPNNMAYVRSVMNQQMGLNRGWFDGIERAVKGYFGTSRSSVANAVGSLKALTYALQLGGSPAYMITTLLGGINMMGISLREAGLGAISPSIIAKTMLDSSGSIFGHLKTARGEDMSGVHMTGLGKEALKYIESNHVLPAIVDNHANFGEGSTLGKNAVGLYNMTTTLPEKMQRLPVFMAFTHMLNESGKYNDLNSLFKRAEDLTNLSMTNMRPGEHAMMFDKLGTIGGMAKMYKAPIFNFINQMHMLSKDAVNNPKKGILPLVGLLGATWALSGLVNTPSLDVLDSVWNASKTGLANHFPEAYAKVTEPGHFYSQLANQGLKGTIMGSMPELAAYGPVSSITNLGIANRMAPHISDLSNLSLSNLVAPLLQEGKEQGAIAKFLIDPNRQTAIQGVYNNAPPVVQGLMESNLPDFKAGPRGSNGTQAYYNPHSLNENAEVIARRTPQEEMMRNFGLKSLRETKETDANYIASKNNADRTTAYNNLVDKMVAAARHGRTEDTESLAKMAIRMNPTADISSTLESKITTGSMTPAEQTMVKENTYRAIQKAQEFRRMNGANK